MHPEGQHAKAVKDHLNAQQGSEQQHRRFGAAEDIERQGHRQSRKCAERAQTGCAIVLANRARIGRQNAAIEDDRVRRLEDVGARRRRRR